MRRSAVFASLIVVLARSEARADEAENAQKAACVDAHVRAQQDRQEGRLLSAVRALDSCSTDACPELVRKDCIAWAETWPETIPSIVVGARDRENLEQTTASLVVDGREMSRRLDGRQIPLDPGPHEVRVILADGTTLTEKLVLREGEKNRAVLLAPKFVASRASDFPSASVWIPIASVATLGTGLFAAFAALGKSKESELDLCAPRCREDDVDEMRRLYVTADVSLVVGAAAVASLGLYFAIGAAVAEPSSGQGFYIGPTRSGAMGGFVSEF